MVQFENNHPCIHTIQYNGEKWKAWFSPLSFKRLYLCHSGCRSPNNEMGVKSTVFRNNHSLRISSYTITTCRGPSTIMVCFSPCTVPVSTMFLEGYSVVIQKVSSIPIQTAWVRSMIITLILTLTLKCRLWRRNKPYADALFGILTTE